MIPQAERWRAEERAPNAPWSAGSRAGEKKKPRPLPHSRGETDEKSAYRYQSTLRGWEAARCRCGAGGIGVRLPCAIGIEAAE